MKEKDAADQVQQFTRKELAQHLNWDRYRVHRAIAPLERGGYFSVEKVGRAYQYSLPDDVDDPQRFLRDVLKPEAMEEKIAEHIDELDEMYLT